MQQLYPYEIALIFNFVDFLTGFLKGVKNHDIDSKKLRDGAFKKVGYIICYFMGWLIDNKAYIIGFDISISISNALLLYVCTTELISIIENICIINPDILPEKLKSIFHVEE